MTEIELKFLLDERTEAQLRSLPALVKLTRGRAVTRRLRTVYHDTLEGHLRQAGIALRLRQTGERNILTVKSGRAMRAGLQSVREVEIELDEPTVELSRIPDPGVRDAIIAALDGRPFVPVLETAIQRQSRTLELSGSIIDYALDVGEVIAGDRRETIRECELELVEGEPQHLFDAAALIFERGPLRFSGVSKAERGWRLIDGLPATAPLEIRRARKVPLDPGMTTGDAIEAILPECLDQIGRNALLICGTDSDDPDAGPAVHQLRVGLRRLRAAIALLPRDHRTPRLEFLIDEARHLAGIAGTVRDLDVLGTEILPGGIAEDEGVASLGSLLADRSGRARRDLAEALASPRTQRFLLELAAAAALGPRRPGGGEIGAGHLDGAAAETLEAALARAWKRVRKRARSIANLDIEDRHELRKALKRLRYTVEFAAPIYPKKRVKPFLRQIKDLQEVFGSLNDLAMAEAVLTGPEAPGLGDPTVQRTVGLLIGAGRVHARHDWEGAKAAWKRLRKTGTFWT